MVDPKESGGESTFRSQHGFRAGVSFKLSLPVLSIIIIFTLISLADLNGNRDLSGQISDLQKMSEAGSGITAISAVTDSQLALPDKLNEVSGEDISIVLESVSTQRRLINRMQSQMDVIPGGMAILQRLRGNIDSVDNLVSREINAAVVSGNAEDFSNLSSELQALREQQKSDELALMLLVQEQIGTREASHVSTMSRRNLFQITSTIAAILISLLLGILLAHKFKQRLGTLSASVKAFASGNLRHRVEMSGDDEITDLARSFNNMAETLDGKANQLIDNQRQLHSIHQSITDGIIVYDHRGRIASLNPAAEVAVDMLERKLINKNTTGIEELDDITSLEQLVPISMQVKCWEEKNCTHPECPSFGSSDLCCWLQCGTHCHNEIQGTFSQKRDACERCDVYIKNGTRATEFEKKGRVFTVMLNPLLDDEGSEQGKMAVLHDITGLRCAEESLRLRNRELVILNDLASMLSVSMDEIDVVLGEVLAKLTQALSVRAGIVITVDSDKDIVCPNAHCGISDHTAAFISMLPASAMNVLKNEEREDLSHADMLQARWKAFEPLLKREGLKKPYIVPFRTGGELFGCLVIADDGKSQYDQDEIRMINAAALLLGVALQNARLFRSVARAKAIWETTFDSMSDAVYVLDDQRNIIRANRAAKDMFNMPVDQVTGRKCYEVTHKCDEPIDECPFMKVIQSGVGETIEVIEESQNKIFRMSLSPIINDNGQVTGIVHVISDITDQRQLREQLVQSEKMAAVGQLVAGVAHELNNPLTGILGYSQLLLKRIPDSDERDCQDLKTIIGETERASKIVQNLLTFARKHKPVKTFIDINDSARSVARLRGYDLNACGIKLEMDLDERLPWTMADAHQLEQVLLNLVNNAAQAIEEGGTGGNITVRTAFSGPDLEVTVTDNGIGICSKNISRVFDPFFTTKEVGKGTGLGLSICYGIIEEQGGDMCIDSVPGEGTTVRFTLPMVQKSVRGQKLDKPGDEEDQAGEGRRSVLLVEDEPAIVDLLSDILTMEGHRVEVAENTSEALKKLAMGTYDNIITDVSDNGMDGQELYKRIREIDSRLAANVVFIADEAAAERNRRNLEGLDNLLLLKPFELHEIRKQLLQFMESSG